MKSLFVLNVIFIILGPVCEGEELGGSRNCFLQCVRSAEYLVKGTFFVEKIWHWACFILKGSKSTITRLSVL